MKAWNQQNLVKWILLYEVNTIILMKAAEHSLCSMALPLSHMPIWSSPITPPTRCWHTRPCPQGTPLTPPHCLPSTASHTGQHPHNGSSTGRPPGQRVLLSGQELLSQGGHPPFSKNPRDIATRHSKPHKTIRR